MKKKIRDITFEEWQDFNDRGYDFLYLEDLKQLVANSKLHINKSEFWEYVKIWLSDTILDFEIDLDTFPNLTMEENQKAVETFEWLTDRCLQYKEKVRNFRKRERQNE